MNTNFYYINCTTKTTIPIKSALIQIGIWAVYWCIEISMYSLSFSGFLKNKSLMIESLINLFIGTVFFYALLFALPKRAKQIKILPLISRILLTIVGCIGLRYGLVQASVEWSNFKSPLVTNLKFFGVSSFDILSRYGIYAALIWFLQRQGYLKNQLLQTKLSEEKLQNELLETKYAILKSQINPHFLFNTLNFIHSKAIISNDKMIDKTILLLSDILRHSLQDIENDNLVSVQKEIEHIKMLKELNSLRFNGNFHFDIAENKTDFDKKIPPLILLTFYENMIKHGVLDEKENPASLHVEMSKDLLKIRFHNKIRLNQVTPKLEKFAIGKRYIENMLNKHYKDNYVLDYHNDGVLHTIYLKIYNT